MRLIYERERIYALPLASSIVSGKEVSKDTAVLYLSKSLFKAASNVRVESIELSSCLMDKIKNSSLFVFKKEETVLIGFEAPGWESLSAELLERVVDDVHVDSSSIVVEIKIHLAADN